MKIYTRTGDKGETGLFGGMRVRKNDERVEAYGTIDELNASLGVAQASEMPASLSPVISQIQGELFVLGAEVACVPSKLSNLKMTLVGQEKVVALEALIDEHENELTPLTQFILPDGSPAGAALHLARTIARRAERRCLNLELRSEVIVYLNRLSDCLFVLARRANRLDAHPESPWTPR